MQKTKVSFLLILTFLLSSFNFGIISAQDTEVELTRRYTPTILTENFSFDYPDGWTVTDFNLDNDVPEDDKFVSLTDGTITIEFYTQAASNPILQLSNNDLEASIPLFISVAQIEIPATTPSPLQTSVIFSGQERVGAFILDGVNGQYILIAQGSDMEETEFIYIRITGATADLLNPDTMEVISAIIDSLGTLAILGDNPIPNATSNTDNTGNTSNTDNNPPPAVVTVACTLQGITVQNADGTNRPTRLRVGPGTNRGVIGSLELGRDFTVIGTNVLSDGQVWWQLDKSEAAPTSQANQTWVADSEVTTTGDCDQVGDASAPPIIRAPQQPVRTEEPSDGSGASPATTQEPQPEPPAGSTIEFYADPYYFIYFGECTTLYWNVTNVTGVSFEGNPVAFQNNIPVCPEFTTTYTLEVILNSGEIQTRTVTIDVLEDDLVFCLIPDDIPFDVYDVSIVDDVQRWDIYIDPCATPMTIFIEMYSTDIDPIIDVNVDGLYAGSDDNSGGNLNAYLVVFLPEGTTVVTIFAQNLTGTAGTYDLIVDILP